MIQKTPCAYLTALFTGNARDTGTPPTSLIRALIRWGKTSCLSVMVSPALSVREYRQQADGCLKVSVYC